MEIPPEISSNVGTDAIRHARSTFKGDPRRIQQAQTRARIIIVGVGRIFLFSPDEYLND